MLIRLTSSAARQAGLNVGPSQQLAVQRARFRSGRNHASHRLPMCKAGMEKASFLETKIVF